MHGRFVKIFRVFLDNLTYKGAMSSIKTPDTHSGKPDSVAPHSQTSTLSDHAPLSTGTFVLILASLMAINALTTDIMLPGFPQMADSLNTETTSIQAVITAYMFGFGASQIIVGFLADRYGRKPVLIIGLLLFMIASMLCAAATSFEGLLVARFIQGIAAGAPRVIVTAAARDCYDGRQLARVISLVLTMFMAAPIFAPAIGQTILIIANWRAVFGVLVIYGLVMLAVCWLYLPETLKPENRRAIRLPVIWETLKSVFGSRQTNGYTLAAGAFFGSLFGFIASAQQLLVGVFGFGLWFPAAFAVMALFLLAASFINSRLVERFGMRLLSHSAVVIFCLSSLSMLILAWLGLLNALLFMVIHSINMLLVGLVFGNFMALAMEPQGRSAGVASSFISAVTVIIGATVGYFIGQAFNGTAIPLAGGFFFSGIATLVVLLITENGQLFKSRPVTKAE
jgi:MFS transporter, DHA1 family, multidrug resistance protein